MDKLLKLVSTLGIADLLRILNDLKSSIVNRRAFIAQRHASGEAYVDRVLELYVRFIAQDTRTEREKDEADAAIGNRTLFYKDARVYVCDLRNRVKLAASLLKKEGEPKLARALLRDYSIIGNKDNINHASHLERALIKSGDAYKLQGNVLIQWGCSPEFIAQAQGFLDRKPESMEKFAKERSESEQAMLRLQERAVGHKVISIDSIKRRNCIESLIKYVFFVLAINPNQPYGTSQIEHLRNYGVIAA